MVKLRRENRRALVHSLQCSSLNAPEVSSPVLLEAPKLPSPLVDVTWLGLEMEFNKRSRNCLPCSSPLQMATVATMPQLELLKRMYPDILTAHIYYARQPVCAHSFYKTLDVPSQKHFNWHQIPYSLCYSGS